MAAEVEGKISTVTAATDADDALAAMDKNDKLKPFCALVSTGTKVILERSEKMKRIVEQAHGVLTYRPANRTDAQADKLWTSIEECVDQTTHGYVRLIKLQCQVMRTLTLLGDAAGLAVRRHNAGVSVASAMEAFDKQMAEYSLIAKTFDTQSTVFIDGMGRVIDNIIRAPGLEAANKVMAEYNEKAPQLYQKMKEAQDKLLKARREFALRIAQAQADYEQKRVYSEALGEVMLAKKELYKGAVEGVKQALQFSAEAARKLATAAAEEKQTTTKKTHSSGFLFWRHSWTEVTTVDNSVDQAARHSQAASDLERCQRENENNAQEAQIQASNLFGSAKAASDTALGVLNEIKAQSALPALEAEFEKAQEEYNTLVNRVVDLLRATGVNQQHVLTFVQQVLEVKHGAINTELAATVITQNILLMDMLLKQNFQLIAVQPLVTVTDARQAMRVRGKKLLPFERMIVDEFGITDKDCCGFDSADTATMIQRLKDHAGENKLSWNFGTENEFKKLCSGALFAPEDAEVKRYDEAVKNHDATARLIVSELTPLGTYMTMRCDEVNRKLITCAEIRSSDKLLK